MKDFYERINGLINLSPLRQLGFSAFTVASMSLVARVVGFLKEIAVASYFGLSSGLDVYVMAFVLIGVPASILLNAIHSVMVSTIASGRNKNNSTIYTSTVVLTSLALLVLLPLWLFILNFNLPWLASGFSPEKLQWLETAIYWLIPYYFFNGANLLAYGVLQAKKRFVSNGLLPIITPAITMLLVIFFNDAGDWQVLIVALAIGAALEFLVVNTLLFRKKVIVKPHIFGNSDLKRLIQGSLVLMIGTSLASFSPIIEQSVAASVGNGTNVALSYGFRFPAALSGLLVTGVGIAVLPYFSLMLAEGKMSYCLHSLDKISRWLLILGIPLSVVLAFFSEQIISLFFQRGAFDATSVARVSPIQQAYFFQLPFALIVMLCIKTLVALNKNSVVSLIVAGTVIAHGSLVWWLGITRGATGIAWGSTISVILTAVVAFLLSRSFLLKKIA